MCWSRKLVYRKVSRVQIPLSSPIKEVIVEKTKVGVETTLASYILGQKVRELTIPEFEDYIGFLKENIFLNMVKRLFKN